MIRGDRIWPDLISTSYGTQPSDREGKREISRVEMVRGFTHDLFYIVKDKIVIYPWHDYVAGENGALFILFVDSRI